MLYFATMGLEVKRSLNFNESTGRRFNLAKSVARVVSPFVIDEDPQRKLIPRNISLKELRRASGLKFEDIRGVIGRSFHFEAEDGRFWKVELRGGDKERIKRAARIAGGRSNYYGSSFRRTFREMRNSFRQESNVFRITEVNSMPAPADFSENGLTAKEAGKAEKAKVTSERANAAAKSKALAAKYKVYDALAAAAQSEV